MKNLVKILMILLLSVSLCACHNEKPEPQPQEIIYDVMGKTFYNKTDKNVLLRGSITLYKEGDFELYEANEYGLVFYRGEYKQRGNEYDLYPENKELPDKIIFRACNEEELILDSKLPRSTDSSVYVPKENIPPVDPFDEDVNPLVYFSIDNSGMGRSFIELYKDGSFILTEVQGYGAIAINGLYGREGNVYMFSNFDPFYNMYGELTYNFEFMVYENENTLVLNEDLASLPIGSIFTLDGTSPEEYMSSLSDKEIAKFVHEPIEGVNEEYLPCIIMRENGEFDLIENCYSGMIPVHGKYSQIPMGYHFVITELDALNGYAGEGVTSFDIYYDNANGGYKIDTDICMTRADDGFNYYYYGE